MKLYEFSKSINSENKYLNELLESLDFKNKSLIYRQRNISEKDKATNEGAKKKISKERCKMKALDWKFNKEKILSEMKKKGVFQNGLIELTLEINSEEIFFEFEALLSELASFVDYFIKILRFYHSDIPTRKRKIIKQINDYVKTTELKNFASDFKDWIPELLNYRNFITHISSMNSNIKINISNSTGSISRVGNGTHFCYTSPAKEIMPIYIPHTIKFKHLIEENLDNKELTYEDDFYTLEEYLKKLTMNFNKFSEKIIKFLKSKHEYSDYGETKK